MAYKLKLWRLPEGPPTARGKAFVNLLPLAQDERVTNILPLPEDEDAWDSLHDHVRDAVRRRPSQQAFRFPAR